jgi:hypothetical protein
VSARLLDIPGDDYFDLDAFSASTAKVLISRSPAHARVGYRKKPTKAMDRGDIIGRLLLGAGKDYEVVNAENWTTKAAREKRDEIRSRGLVPVLHDDLEDYHTAAETIRVKLADRGLILDGLSEQAITWTEHTDLGDVTCKGRFDHVWPDFGTIIDLKVTADASPAFVERNAENLGYAIQAAAYTRALAQLKPDLAGKIGFAFIFAEAEEPYALNISEPDGIFQEIGERRWLRAVREWARCIKENHWPSYGTAVNPITSPSWALAREGYSTDDR